jgi:hypothetical protein
MIPPSGAAPSPGILGRSPEMRDPDGEPLRGHPRILSQAAAGIRDLLPNGSLDPNFGTGGAARIAFGNFDATANALALQPNEGQEQ